MTKIDIDLLENNNRELEEYKRKGSSKILDIFATNKLYEIRNGKIEMSYSTDKITKLLFRQDDTILTLNYDCCLENILLIQGKWSTTNGWGTMFRPNKDIPPSKFNIKIFKLHGSINFVLVAPLDVGGYNRSKLMIKWIVNNDFFPNPLERNKWTETIQEYVVLPSYLKQFEYKDILESGKNLRLGLRKQIS